MKLPGSICCRLFRCAKHFIMLQGILIHIFMNFIGLLFYFCSSPIPTFIFSVLYHIIFLLYSYMWYGFNSTKRKRPVWARIDVDYRNQWWVYFIFGLCQAPCLCAYDAWWSYVLCRRQSAHGSQIYYFYFLYVFCVRKNQ